jgi:hypothetical protein
VRRNEVLHLSTERRGIDRRVPIQLTLDLLEQAQQSLRHHQAASDERLDVHYVARVGALQFGECLRVEIIVMEREVSFLPDESAALLPAAQRARPAPA